MINAGLLTEHAMNHRYIIILPVLTLLSMLVFFTLHASAEGLISDLMKNLGVINKEDAGGADEPHENFKKPIPEYRKFEEESHGNVRKTPRREPR